MFEEIKKSKKQFISFGIIGILSTLIDGLVYFLILSFAFFEIPIAKSLSFIAGTLNSYFLNRAVTFRSNISHVEGSIKHFTIYGSSLIINVLVNTKLISLFESLEYSYSIELAFFLATSLSILINFLGLRFFVFNNH